MSCFNYSKKPTSPPALSKGESDRAVNGTSFIENNWTLFISYYLECLISNNNQYVIYNELFNLT